MKNIIVLIISVIFLSISCNNTTEPIGVDADKGNKEPINLGDRVGTYTNSSKEAVLTVSSNQISYFDNTSSTNPSKTNISPKDTNTNIELPGAGTHFKHFIEFDLQSTNEAMYKRTRNKDDKVTETLILKRK